MLTLFTALLAGSALAAPAPAPASLAKRDFSGRTTFYRPEDSNPMTACGVLYSDANRPIVALSMSQFNMGLCHQWITVTYQGKTVSAEILDGCETCSYGQIDLSPGAMSQLDSNYASTGQFTASWSIGGGGGGDSSNNNNKEETTTTTEKPTTTWTPEPTTTTTWTPEPTTTTTTAETTTTATTTTLPPSSSSSSSSLSSSITTTLNATTTAVAATMNATTTVLPATVAVHNATATTIAPDAIVSTAASDESGNLAGLNAFVAHLGRLVIAGAAV